MVYKWDLHWSETVFGLVLKFLSDTDSYQVSLVRGLATNNRERMLEICVALVANPKT